MSNKQYIKDLVSVVIPTYNQQDFIEETIQSISSQTYKNIEIIICDDGSTDNTPTILKKISREDNRIHLILSDVNCGISENVNRGFKAVSGEFVCLIGGDDIMLPTKIQKQVDYLMNNSDIALVLTEIEVFNKNETLRYYKQDEITSHPFEWVFFTNFFFHKKSKKFTAVTPLARSIYFLNSMYDTRLPYKNEVYHALENHLKLPKYKWYVIPEVLTRYRMHNNNVSKSTAMNDKLWEEHCLIHGLICANYPEYALKYQHVRDYFLFCRLLFNELPALRSKELKKFFYRNAGMYKNLHLFFCKIMLRLHILFLIVTFANKMILVFQKRTSKY